ncbi:MAG: efflux RND transporter periplasmic adaptor subunit [Candidatus Binatia bacterium]
MRQTGSMLFVAAVVFFAFLGCGEKKETDLDHRTEAKKTSEKGKEEKHEGETKGEQKHAEEKERVKLSPEALKNAGIKTAPAKAEAIAETLAVTATIAHNQDRLFHVTPRITGRVVDVRVSLGSGVKAGSILAVLDSTELGQAKSEYIKAQTLLDLAKANYEREKSLFDQKIAAKKDVLAAEAEYRKAEAEARSFHERLRLYGLSDQAINNLNNSPSLYTLTSPGPGVVIEREMSKGEVIEAGKKVATISDLSTVWVLLNIHEKDLAKVKQGATVKIHTESYPGEVFAGKVAYIGNVVDPQTRTVPLRVEVPNPRARLKPGMFATAEVVTGTSSTEAIMIPSSAIQKIEGKPSVFVQGKDGSFAKRELDLGREFGNSVEVKAGLKEGEQVVVTGAFTLKSELLKEGLEGHGH